MPNYSKFRTCTDPILTLNLTTRPLALLNLKFLVTEDEIASEDIVIGQPILQNLIVDLTHLLEQKREVLNDADCSHVGIETIPGFGRCFSRVMIPRKNHSNNSHLKGLVYYEIWMDTDPFPDPSPMYPIDCNRAEELSDGFQEMLQIASQNCRTIGDLGYDPRAVITHRQTHPVDGRAWWGLAEGQTNVKGKWKHRRGGRYTH